MTLSRSVKVLLKILELLLPIFDTNKANVGAGKPRAVQRTFSKIAFHLELGVKCTVTVAGACTSYLLSSVLSSRIATSTESR